MKLFTAVLVFLSAVCLSPVAWSQSLEWKLKKGQTLAVESVIEMVTSMQLPDGTAQEMPMKQQFDSEWKVSESDEKSFLVQTTIKRMRTSMKSPFMNVDYDSEKEEPKDLVGKQLAATMKPILGSPIALKIGRRGNLIEMKLPESVEKLSATPSTPVSANSLKNSVWQQIEFPEGDLKVGAEWEQMVDSNMNGMKTKVRIKFRNDGVVEEQGRKMVKIHSDVTTELIEPPAGIEMTLEDTGSEGEVLFDLGLGCISKQVQRQKFRMNMSVGGQKLSQDIDGSTTTIYRLAN